MKPSESVMTYLRSLTTERFWGFITVKFEDGVPVHLRKEENLKPASLSTNHQQPEKARTYTDDHNN